MSATERLNWERRQRADGFPLWIEAAQVPTHGTDGRPAGERTIYRVSVGDTRFAGAVAVVVEESSGRVLFVRQTRVRVDRVLWELPRGMADANDSDPVATALRELHEETGVSAASGEWLGMVYPDSGILASEVGVVRIELAHEPGEVDDTDGEVDDSAWLTPVQIRDLIAAGDVRDGLSLAALTVAEIL